ncbi:hypothetical protein Rs2_03640 [Raphanus sativus]|nr:hypothetical protein Rs2_03640 [Raphanus sativus]
MVPTMVTTTAKMSINHDTDLSTTLRALLCFPNRNAIRAGNVKASETADVAPVNLNAVPYIGDHGGANIYKSQQDSSEPQRLLLGFRQRRGGEPSNSKPLTVSLSKK